MSHLDGRASFSGKKGRVQGDIADVASSHVELRKPLDIEIAGRSLRGEDALPDGFALARIGKWKVDDETEAALEGFIQRGLEVGSENRDALEVFHPLQQVADFDVGVAVVTIFDLGPFAEERVRFIEEQQNAALFCGIEDLPQVLLG